MPYYSQVPNKRACLFKKRVKFRTPSNEGGEYPLGRDLAHVLSIRRPFRPRAQYPNTDGWRLFLKFR